MDLVLRGLHWERCLVYLDDIIVHGRTFEEHLDNLRLVWSRLREANLKMKPSKCTLFQDSVAFLGHVVSRDGVRCDPAKIEAVREWRQPASVTEVRSFLGLASFYRRFIPGFVSIAAPLTMRTENGAAFQWSDECCRAFAALKNQLTKAPVLAYPRSEGKFVLDTDVSGAGIGAVLSQVQDGQERVIAYASKTMNRTPRRYCTTQRELLAVVTFVKHFRHYLLGRHFLLCTDHTSLRWLVNFREP